MNKVLNDEKELNARIFQFPNSAIKYNGKKINYYDFINNYDDINLKKAIINIVPKINVDKINNFIDNVAYISNLQKKFYKYYIKARYDILLLPVTKK